LADFELGKENNIIIDKSFAFAVKTVNVCRSLSQERKEYVLSKQLLKSGTSIGANIQEAQAAQSRKDFVSKMSIAGKEARETKYWLDLLSATGYIDIHDADNAGLLIDIEEIVKILTSIIKTTKESDYEE